MDKEILNRILNALSRQGSSEYVTPSGAMLELMTELAKTGHLQDMSDAFKLFVVAYPSNARYVASSVGAKLLNHFLIPCLGLNGANRFLKWEKSHKDWSSTLADSLPTGMLRQVATNMLADIRQFAP